MKHTIESVMTAEVVTARPSTPFRELADLLKVYLRPDPAISWEVMHDVVHDRLGIRDGGVAVEVRHGVVNLAGQVERRSQVGELVRQVQAVDGVVSVDARLAWNVDDVTLMTAWPIA